jgi:hypothetical protein
MPKLKATKGTDEVNYGTERYPVEHGEVDVPQEAVADLVKTGGFVPADEPAVEADTIPAADVRVALKHPSGPTGASVDGESFVPDENGVIHVPPSAVVALLDHGFEELA